MALDTGSQQLFAAKLPVMGLVSQKRRYNKDMGLSPPVGTLILQLNVHMGLYKQALITTGVSAVDAGQWQAQALQEGRADCRWSRGCSCRAARGREGLQVGALTMQMVSWHKYCGLAQDCAC